MRELNHEEILALRSISFLFYGSLKSSIASICQFYLGLGGFEIFPFFLDLAFHVLVFHWKQKSSVKILLQCRFYLSYIWNSFQCFEKAHLVFYAVGLFTPYLIATSSFEMHFSISFKELHYSKECFFLLKHWVKYARVRVFSHCISPILSL